MNSADHNDYQLLRERIHYINELADTCRDGRQAKRYEPSVARSKISQ